MNDRFICTQEVPRKPDRGTQTTFYLFTHDLRYSVQALIDFIYVIILNLRSRQKVVVMKHAVGLTEITRRVCSRHREEATSASSRESR